MALKIPFLTVEPVVYCCMASFSLLMVSIPQLLLDNICRRKYNNATKCLAMEAGFFKEDYDDVQQESAIWLSGYIGTATAVILVTLPTVGVISDAIGRRMALFLTPVSQIIQCLSLICIVSSGMQFATWLVLMPAIIPAIVADISGLYVFASAYICSVTSEEQRTLRMTVVDAAALLANFTATLSSGFVIERFGYVGIYVFIIILSLLAILDLIFFVEPDVEKIVTNKGQKPDIPVGIRDEATNTVVIANPTRLEILLGSSLNDGPADEEPQKDLSLTDETGIRDGTTKSVAIRNPTSLETSLGFSLNDGPAVEKPQKDLKFTDQTKPVVVTQIDVQNTQNDSEKFAENSSIPVNSTINSKGQSNGEAVSIKKLLRHFNPVKNFTVMARTLKALRHMNIVVAIMLVMGLSTISYFGEAGILVLYLKNHPFYYTAREVGYMLAYESALIGLVGLLLFNWILQRCFKLRDITMLLISAATCIPYQILMGFANSTAMLYSVQILHAVCSLNTPTMRSLLSKMVEKSSVGSMMGAIAMVETLAAMIGGLAIPVAYAGLLPYYPGAVFFVLAAIMVVAVVIIAICALVFPKDINAEDIE